MSWENWRNISTITNYLSAFMPLHATMPDTLLGGGGGTAPPGGREGYSWGSVLYGSISWGWRVVEGQGAGRVEGACRELWSVTVAEMGLGVLEWYIGREGPGSSGVVHW